MPWKTKCHQIVLLLRYVLNTHQNSDRNAGAASYTMLPDIAASQATRDSPTQRTEAKFTCEAFNMAHAGFCANHSRT